MPLVTTLRLLLVSVLLMNVGEVRAQQAEDPAPSEETDTATDAAPEAKRFKVSGDGPGVQVQWTDADDELF